MNDDDNDKLIKIPQAGPILLEEFFLLQHFFLQHFWAQNVTRLARNPADLSPESLRIASRVVELTLAAKRNKRQRQRQTN